MDPNPTQYGQRHWCWKSAELRWFMQTSSLELFPVTGSETQSSKGEITARSGTKSFPLVGDEPVVLFYSINLCLGILTPGK